MISSIRTYHVTETQDFSLIRSSRVLWPSVAAHQEHTASCFILAPLLMFILKQTAHI